MKYILFFIIVFSCAKLPKSRKEIDKNLHKPLKKQISPFLSDGCSFWPEGHKSNKTRWLKCCILHDLAYWAGGIKKARVSADNELKKCVEKSYGDITAYLMYLGTRLGGSPKYKTPFKWGYGWNYDRGYLKITKEENQHITKLSPKKGEDLMKYVDLNKLDSEIKNLTKKILY